MKNIIDSINTNIKYTYHISTYFEFDNIYHLYSDSKYADLLEVSFFEDLFLDIAFR